MMDPNNYNKYLEKQEFVDNNAKRIPVCIVVDCSGSMGLDDDTPYQRIERVNQGIELFYQQTQEDPKTRRAVDVCIIAVGDTADVIQDFSNTDKKPQWIRYRQSESGDLVLGVKRAIELLEQRKKVYKDNGINYWQPWLMVMSDGRPTRKGDDHYNSVQNNGNARRELEDFQNNDIKPREAEEKLVVFPVIITKDDDNSTAVRKGKNCLANFSNYRDRLIVLDPRETSFEKLFKFLHKSASSVASGKGFIKDSEYGNYNARNDSQKPDGQRHKFFDYSKFENSVEQEPDIQETETYSADDLNKAAEAEAERIRKLKEESSRQLDVEENEEIQPSQKSTFAFYVNGKQTYPIKGKSGTSQIVFTSNIKGGDVVKIEKDGHWIRFDNNTPECRVGETGRYQFEVRANDVAVCLQIEKTKSSSYSSSKEIKDINDKIEEIISSTSNWDKI